MSSVLKNKVFDASFFALRGSFFTDLSFEESFYSGIAAKYSIYFPISPGGRLRPSCDGLNVSASKIGNAAPDELFKVTAALVPPSASSRTSCSQSAQWRPYFVTVEHKLVTLEEVVAFMNVASAFACYVTQIATRNSLCTVVYCRAAQAELDNLVSQVKNAEEKAKKAVVDAGMISVWKWQ